MLLDFANKTKLQKDALVGEGYFYLQEAAKLSKSLAISEEVERKTAKQLKGFYRICGILAPYFEESEGTFFDKDMVKEYVKQEANYALMVKGVKVSKSLTKASIKEMKAMIEKLYEIGAFFDAKGYELTSEEKKAMNEYYKLTEK